MTRDPLSQRIRDQFSYRGRHADIWRVFDLLFDANRYLNIGYSPRYQPYIPGRSQRHLPRRIGRAISHRLPATSGVRLLDVGCGRGGPAVHFADYHGFVVTGIDLVPYNVRAAVENASSLPNPPTFVVGDARRLPFAPDTFGVCTVLDAGVYVPDKAQLFEQLHTVVEEDGLVVTADLLMADGATTAERDAVVEFAEAWDMPPIPTVSEYERRIERAGFSIREAWDISANSTARFRKWTRLYLAVVGSGLEPWLDRILRNLNTTVDVSGVTDQVRRAHEALPHLRHVVVFARRAAERYSSAR